MTASLGSVFLLTEARELQDATTGQLTLIIVAYVVSIAFALALRLGLRVAVLAYAQILVDAILVSMLVVTTGGIESVFTVTYVFVVIGGAMTLYRRGVVMAVLASLLLLGTVAVVQVDNSVRTLPRVEGARAALSMFTYVTGLVLVGGLAGTLAENLRTTGRRLAQKESEFERLEELHAAILRSLPGGVLTLDGAGVVRYANDAAMAILRLAPPELFERPLAAVVPAIAERWRRILEEGRAPHPRDRFECSFARSGSTSIRIGFSFAPLGQKTEEPGGVIVVFQDVTEIVRLREAFERAERLATLGKLAAGLAHEVRNPLSSMCASIDVLKTTLSPPDSVKRLMDNVVREGDRLNALISDFLTFARPRELNRKPVDVSQVMSALAEVFRHEAQAAGTVVTTTLDSGLVASIDADLIRQVIWNLAKNAVQAIGQQGGHIQLEAHARDQGVELVVRDDGPGIPAEALSRIFDPFFTTKDRGTGLGLAIAHSIVQAHGGKLLVSSTVGEGTEFAIWLPKEVPPRVPSLAPDASTPAGTMTERSR
ncbi:MAG: PAS domain-containing protein [Deltaproteobacteria bacterium]|nr:PAS domain-containing protein [Deltaproteobacteria bacterium]